MKKLMLMTLAAAALLVAAPAQAKELLGAQLCGPGGCVTERAAGMLEGQNGPFGGELVAPATRGPWYRGSPWSDGNYVVAYPKSHLLLRDGQFVSLPGTVASRLASGRSLDSGREIPWTPIAAAIAVLVPAAALVRRRAHPRPAPQPVAQA